MNNYYSSRRRRVIEPEESKQFTICGRDIDTFYYNIPKQQRGLSNITTPNKTYTRPSSAYSGKYHPICKIRLDSYNVLNVSETDIKYKTNIVYDPLNTRSISEINNIDPILAVSMLVCQFHSLNKRLESYIVRIKNRSYIDTPHMNAAYYIIDNVKKSLRILDILDKNKKLSIDFNYICIMNSISTYFGNIDVIEKIFNMIKDYNTIYLDPRYSNDFEYKNRIVNFIDNIYLNEYKNKIEPTPPKLIKRSRSNIAHYNNNINNINNINKENKEPKMKNNKINIQRSLLKNKKKRLAFQQINNNK